MNKIKQIIPSDGWYIKLKDKKTGIEDDYPLACWALIIDYDLLDDNEEPTNYIVGFFPEDGSPFLDDAECFSPKYDGMGYEFIGYVRD